MPLPLHPWAVTPDEAVAHQLRLAPLVDVASPLPPVRLVAGADIAYSLTAPVAFAAVVVWDVARRQELTRAVVREAMVFPYVPGLLSFRECPPILSAFASLRVRPDALLLDGQGIAHPRRFGLAAHLGLWLNLPAVGCAKTWLCGEYAEPGPSAGESSPLTLDGGTVGAVVRTAAGVRPCFVSPGHRCDVPGAVGLVRAVLSGYRHPTPTRLAHLAANEARAAEFGPPT